MPRFSKSGARQFSGSGLRGIAALTPTNLATQRIIAPICRTIYSALTAPPPRLRPSARSRTLMTLLTCNRCN